MKQSSSLHSTLKKQLKAHGKTYSDVAQWLELSEASVKRLFADESFSLQRFESVCEMIDLTVADIVTHMEVEQPQLRQLEEHQEKDIVEDLPLLMVALSVINGYNFDELMDQFTFSEHELIQMLAKLDRIKLIELLPGNRIKLLIAPNFRWRPNGPIQRFFLERVQQEFFQSRFENDEEMLLVLNGIFSKSSNSEMQKKIRILAKEFNGLLQQDAPLPPHEKHGNTMVVAIRRWQYEPFRKYLKQ
ncbi:helix-turn-helix transcriptional regulator [Teredinibacter sp. KSP-S5-2]|uniref:helix-turn-helix domain-containing protein n=1 Tax=Teredinibacter sp. KSP-S5-2 TaxID=3034506 RepID=UPI0029347F49|nr:helix-turn-helix transcriptional regulator [Teredinibacter sp. KSP-S5-2]WNO08771.1 helix-turn-helix transcriptional regulator [Teredinibacter sp. KSP-S5-2]